MHLSINTLPVYTLNSNNQLIFIPLLSAKREIRHSSFANQSTNRFNSHFKQSTQYALCNKRKAIKPPTPNQTVIAIWNRGMHLTEEQVGYRFQSISELAERVR